MGTRFLLGALIALVSSIGLLGAPVELSIVGTGVRFDRFGLPVRMEGIVFHRGGALDGVVAGTYSETLKPTLHPLLGFTGTTGQSEFRLFRRTANGVEIESIVSTNISKIVGEVLESGALIVESSGEIAAAGESGPRVMRSRSDVVLEPTLKLDVHVSVVDPDAAKEEEPAPDAPRVTDASAPAASGVRVSERPDGSKVLRYSLAAKNALVGRLTGPNAVTPAALATETGLPERVFRRWIVEANEQARMRQNIARALFNPGPTPRSFQERLEVVIRAASFSDGELEAYLEDEGVSSEEVGKWRAEIVQALERREREGTPERTPEANGSGGRGEADEALRALDSLHRALDSLHRALETAR